MLVNEGSRQASKGGRGSSELRWGGKALSRSAKLIVIRGGRSLVALDLVTAIAVAQWGGGNLSLPHNYNQRRKTKEKQATKNKSVSFWLTLSLFIFLCTSKESVKLYVVLLFTKDNVVFFTN